MIEALGASFDWLACMKCADVACCSVSCLQAALSQLFLTGIGEWLAAVATNPVGSYKAVVGLLCCCSPMCETFTFDCSFQRVDCGLVDYI